jgi:hypothetical protein
MAHRAGRYTAKSFTEFRRLRRNKVKFVFSAACTWKKLFSPRKCASEASAQQRGVKNANQKGGAPLRLFDYFT